MKEFKSSCPDNDMSADAELVRFVESMTNEQRKEARAKGEPCIRNEGELPGHVFAKSPDRVAVILDEHDFIVIMTKADFEEAWV